jgi:hypothetical protein
MKCFFSKSLLLVLMAAGAFSVCAQSGKNKGDFSVWRGIGPEWNGATNVTYAKKGDTNPDRIKVKGVIVDAVFPQIYCGNMGHAGTFKFKPDEKIQNYSDEFVYVVVLCPAGNKEEDLLNKHVEISATKLTKYPYGSSSVKLSNKFHTKKTLFYVLDVEGTGGNLLKKLQIKSELGYRT